ncbi:exported hypothetical protein [Thiomonas delicata]|uniref:Uncharacterized protein n=1 Tax=Thiomonas delicata TaxID=364030 RepID=A0A238D7D5_THIDL|nr:exported hypothetical protein [Thiomonas delicata]
MKPLISPCTATTPKRANKVSASALTRAATLHVWAAERSNAIECLCLGLGRRGKLSTFHNEGLEISTTATRNAKNRPMPLIIHDFFVFKKESY